MDIYFVSVLSRFAMRAIFGAIHPEYVYVFVWIGVFF